MLKLSFLFRMLSLIAGKPRSTCHRVFSATDQDGAATAVQQIVDQGSSGNHPENLNVETARRMEVSAKRKNEQEKEEKKK